MEARTDIELKSLRADNAEAMYRWMLDPEVADNLGLRRQPSLAGTVEWIKRAMVNSACHPFAIELSGQHVGNVILDELDVHLRSARLSIYVGEPDVRGAGVGTAAIELILNYAFETVGLNKVWLIVHANNQRALRTYQRVGFSLEGMLRDGFLFRGEFVDANYMGMLRADYVRRVQSSSHSVES